MKKRLGILSAFTFLAFLLFTDNTFASGHEYNVEDFNSCVSSSCVALCGYNNKIDNHISYSAYIYYDLDKSTFYVKWYYKGKTSSGTDNVLTMIIDDTSSSVVHVNNTGTNLTKYGTCPEHVYIDTSDAGEICFSNENSDNEKNCTKNYEGTSLKKYDWLEEYKKNPSMDLLHGKSEPQFMLNNQEYNKVKIQESTSETAENNTNSTSESGSSKPEGYGILPKDEDTEESEETDYTEEGVLGTLSGDLEKILNLISYLGPILVIIFSSLEYLKATLNSDNDALKKANSRFIKRLIAAVALFFVKPIVYTIINLIG